MLAPVSYRCHRAHRRLIWFAMAVYAAHLLFVVLALTIGIGSDDAFMMAAWDHETVPQSEKRGLDQLAESPIWFSAAAAALLLSACRSVRSIQVLRTHRVPVPRCSGALALGSLLAAAAWIAAAVPRWDAAWVYVVEPRADRALAALESMTRPIELELVAMALLAGTYTALTIALDRVAAAQPLLPTARALTPVKRIQRRAWGRRQWAVVHFGLLACRAARAKYTR